MKTHRIPTWQKDPATGRVQLSTDAALRIAANLRAKGQRRRTVRKKLEPLCSNQTIFQLLNRDLI